MDEPVEPAWDGPVDDGKAADDTYEVGGEPDRGVIDGEIVPDNGILGTVISDDGSPTFEEVRFRLAPHIAVSPGSSSPSRAGTAARILVSWVLCRVLDVHEINPHEDPQSATVRDVLPFDSAYAREGESTVIYRLVRCQPVEELPVVGSGIGDPTEIRTLPRAGDAVCRPRPGMVAAAMGFPADPDDGLHMGSLHSDGSIPVTVDPTRCAAARADRRRHRQRQELHPRGLGRGTPPARRAAGQHRRQRRDDRGRGGAGRASTSSPATGSRCRWDH